MAQLPALTATPAISKTATLMEMESTPGKTETGMKANGRKEKQNGMGTFSHRVINGQGQTETLTGFFKTGNTKGNLKNHTAPKC